MKKILTLAIVALVVPSVALAGKPADPGKSQSASHPAPMVLYVFKGVITSITADSTPVTNQGLNTSGANPPSTILLNYTCDNGAVTITVKRVNHKRVFKALTDNNDPLTLTFCLNAKSKVIVKGSGRVDLRKTSVTLGGSGNHGMVKVRYAKKFDPTATAPTLALKDFLTNGAKQVIVKKALPTS